ncbi:MAG: hypothetical protein ABI882_08910 [Acidobacteriota bacterium]
MASRFRKRSVFAGLALLIAAAGWIYVQRVPRIDLATRVPASAIGFLEFNDWPNLADQFTSMPAWRELSPAYGIWDRWRYLGNAGWLLRITGIGPREALVISRAQIAVIVTSLEVRGEDVRPRLAMVLESHSRDSQLASVIDERLPQLAARAFGNPQCERSEYAGVPVTIYHTEDGNRRMLSAQVGSQWVVANHPEAMEACLDARLGRVPSMAGNFYLQNARPVVANHGQVFGFVSGEGATRLTRFAAALIGVRLFGSSPLAEGLQSVLGDLSSVVSNGLAYGMTIENGQTIERYAWLCHPQMIEQLRHAITVKEGALDLPRLVPFGPAGVDKVTIVRVTEPERAFAALEAVISSRLGAAQSYIFNRFIIGAKEALFGLRENETFGAALGDELGSISLGSANEGSLWALAVRDRDRLEKLTGQFLTQGGATIRRERVRSDELMVSSDDRRGAAAFLEKFLVLGSRPAVIRLIEARAGAQTMAESPVFAAAGEVPRGTPIVSFWSVRGETAEMMEQLAQYLPYGTPRGGAEKILDGLPMGSSTLAIEDQSLVGESHSPFGSLPVLLSLFREKEPGREGN